MNNNTLFYDNIMLEKVLSLSASLYPKLYLFEWVLKNELFNVILKRLGNDWFAQQIAQEEKSDLLKQELFLIYQRKSKGYQLTDHGLLQESSLGFWVEFFNREPYKQHKGAPIHIFKNLHAGIKRKEIYQKLTSIKDFRNLLFHARIFLTQAEDRDVFIRQFERINQDLESFFKWVDIQGYDNITMKDYNDQVEALKALSNNT